MYLVPADMAKELKVQDGFDWGEENGLALIIVHSFLKSVVKGSMR